MTKKPAVKKSPADLSIALQELLQKRTISTQEEICEALNQQGFDVNQTKISRLLHKLGVMKTLENNLTVYRLPQERPAITASDSLKFVITSIKHNEFLIVIRTLPGSAQLVAHLLDHGNDLGILGTVAGDDTIFITPESTKKIQTVYDKIYRLLLREV
jgi:transcriptional regulator of arginine metabolism